MCMDLIYIYIWLLTLPRDLRTNIAPASSCLGGTMTPFSFSFSVEFASPEFGATVPISLSDLNSLYVRESERESPICRYI